MMPQIIPSFNVQASRHSFYGWPNATQAPPPRMNHAPTTSFASNAPNRAHVRHSIALPSAGSMQVDQPSIKAPTRTARPSNILFETEYQQEIFDYMHNMEKQTMANVELMNVQPELHWFMRPYLVDFLIEIHQSFRLRPETLYLTMNIVDRYVSKRIVYKRHYQLVGCAALLIAAKYEDSKDRVPTVQELSQMCCNAYDASAFTQMEGHVLSTLDWNLGHPSAETWLRYEYSCAPPANPSTHSVARFLLEVTLFHQSFISILPSTLAAGAMLLARYICRDPRMSVHPLGATASNAANQIHSFIAEQMSDLSLILIKKYSYSYYSEASTLVLDWLRKREELKKAAESSANRFRQESTLSDEDGESVRSIDSSASLFSTPSRSMTRDEDEDESMPVTPMSLHSVQDPSHVGMGSLRHQSNGFAMRTTPQGGGDPKQLSSVPWMSLANLKPVAKHPMRSARVEMTPSNHMS